MSIMILLIGLAVPAVNSLSKSNSLSTSGRLVGNLLTAARSEAINRRRLVQVRVVTKWSTDASLNYRRLSVWVRPQDGDPVQPAPGAADAFVQVSKWETLPDGILIDNDRDPENFLSAGTANAQVGGVAVEFAAVQFDPAGGASLPSAVGETQEQIYLLLMEGILEAGGVSPVYTHQKQNWVKARITSLTGRLQILRP